MNKNTQIVEYSPLVLQNPALADFVARLPGFDHMGKPHSEPEYYGASGLIASKLRMAEVPRTKAKWSHGWKYQPVDHVVELGEYRDQDANYLVARTEHRDVLLKEGFQNAHVVGMPFVYAPEREQTLQMKNSLLVCPGHVGNFSVAEWDTFSTSYAALIDDLRDQFETVAVCLSASCVETGNWIDAFEAIGVPWFMGASIYDRNALPRMKQIFSSFEYLTSNTIGSHLAYAAYSGCRVSIYGWQDLYTEELLKDEPYSKKYPEVMRKSLAFMKESNLRERHPDLFVPHPREASVQKDWAANQLGAHHRREDAEMAELFGWAASVMKGSQLPNYRPACSVPSHYVEGDHRAFAGKLIGRLQKRKFQRYLAERSCGYVELFGKPFKYTDSQRLLVALNSLRHMESLPAPLTEGAPVIVDASAEDGLFAICSKNRWPNGHVIAVERCKNSFAALCRNCETFEIETVEVRNGLLSEDRGVKEFELTLVDSFVQRQLVGGMDLGSLVKHDTVTLLRLKLNAFDRKVLNCLKDWSERVEMLWLDWQSTSGDGGELSLSNVFETLGGFGFEFPADYERHRLADCSEATLEGQQSITLIATRKSDTVAV